MLPSPIYKRVFIANYKVDFRKSHDGLLSECFKMGLSPVRGDVILFIGSDRRRIKILFADRNGLWLAYKRFNCGTLKTKFSFLNNCSQSEISEAELSMFMEGSSYQISKRLKNS